MYCRGRIQQRAWLLALAGINRVPADRPVPVTDDGLQKTRITTVGAALRGRPLVERIAKNGRPRRAAPTVVT